MHLGELHRARRPTPSIDRTSREFELPLKISTVEASTSTLRRRAVGHSCPSQSPSLAEGDMLAPNFLVPFGAGESYTNAIMGQLPSAAEREQMRKASSTILREHSIRIEEEPYEPALETPDSYSMHYVCTDQAPYSSPIADDKMMTQTSLLRQLPKDNPSRELAFFLKTTGPPAPHRKPSKADSQKRRGPKDAALRFFRVGQKRSTARAEEETPVPQRPGNNEKVLLKDEGGLLLPKNVEQKVSSTGKRYLALQVAPSIDQSSQVDRAPTISPDVISSHVSVAFGDETSPLVDNWLGSLAKDEFSMRYTEPTSRRASTVAPLARVTCPDDSAVHIITASSPIRPAASSPPTPIPGSAVSGTSTFFEGSLDDSRHSYQAAKALSSHPLNQAEMDRLQTPRTSIALPHEEFPVRHVHTDDEIEIRHPFPRRLGSYPVLLNRASTMVSEIGPRSFTESPVPPPRSPLRPCPMPTKSLDGAVTRGLSLRRATPKLAPSIRSVSEYSEMEPIKATVTTECTGPIKRPKSRGKKSYTTYAMRQAREERIRSRKMRDRPLVQPNIDAVVNMHGPPPASGPRRLRKRPQIQIPNAKAAAPAPRCTSAASSRSNASWHKITEMTLTPVSGSPAEGSPVSPLDKSTYTPISTAPSHVSKASEITLSPVMMMAEELPLPKTKSPPRPTKLLVRDGKPYSPRPRSASMSRAGVKRRSFRGLQTPPRSVSPVRQRPKREATPPLPSPPPNRALPPTPPASGSERLGKLSASKPVPPTSKDLRELPTMVPRCETPAPRAETTATPRPGDETVSQDVTPMQERQSSTKMYTAAQLNARLEALEKQNAMLQAALLAVLRTNGTLNGPLSDLTAVTAATVAGAVPASPTDSAAWEPPRSARRSQSSHAPSSSNGSALEMYMSTRRGGDILLR